MTSHQYWKFLVAAGALALGLAACSSKNSGTPGDAGPPPCDPTKCMTGNQCIDDGTGPQCRLVCTTQSGCNPNTHCTEAPNGMVAYCAADKTSYTPGPGQWGVSCKPTGGILKNPDCDFADGFACFAQSPTDANAYCTQLGCSDDTDCKGGWWCATANVAPNAQSVNRSNGTTFTLCEPRNYCATCTADVDCAWSDTKEHCILDKNGNNYCSPECTTDTNCNNEARCLTVDQSAVCNGKNGPCVCAARAQECIGDGNLCSPCLSDKDCPMGFCIQADYSSEHFCTVKSGVPCTVDMTTGMLTDQCPKSDEAKAAVGCTTAPEANNAPQDQCVGLVTFGVNTETSPPSPQYVLGCYTPNR